MSLPKTFTAVLLVNLLTGCSVLESDPIDEEETGRSSLPRSYLVEQINRVAPPFGDIDDVFLDGAIPDAVNYDIMSGRLWRFHVLERGELSLGDENQFDIQLQVSEYMPRQGDDEGPFAEYACSASGSFSEADEMVLLYGAGAQGGDITAQKIGQHILRIEALGATCTFEYRGTEYSREFHLSGIEYVRQVNRTEV